MQSGLRVLSVGRILIGAVVPGVGTFIHLRIKKRNSIADFVSCCAVLAERGALLDLVGDLRSLAVLGIRLLGQTKI